MIRGQKHALKTEVLHIHKEEKVNIHNRFDIEVVDAKTGKVKQKAYAENIVLNTLWTKLLTPATYFNYIHYGTGTGTLEATRTALFMFLAAKAAITPTYVMNENGKYGTCRRTCQLAETEHIGSTLSEVGIGYAVTSASLVTHALLKDMNGNTITIVKTNTDLINIYATVFLYWVNAGNVATVLLDRSSGIGYSPITYPGSVGSLFTFLTGGSATLPNYLYYAKGSAACAYTVGQGAARSVFFKAVTLSVNSSTKKITLASTRLAVAESNYSIREIGLMYGNSENTLGQFIFKAGDSFYPKTSIIGEAIGTGDGNIVGFKTIFPYVQSGYKVYVNGVEASNVTIQEDRPDSNVLDYFMEVIQTGLYTINSSGYTAYLPFPGKKLTAGAISAGGGGLYCIFKNPFYTLGIDTYSISYMTLQTSNDMIIWGTALPTGDNQAVPTDQKNKIYWRAIQQFVPNYLVGKLCDLKCNSILPNNVVFGTAPPLGAVITADYDTETIAKDVNHVFDFSFEITLAEKTS